MRVENRLRKELKEIKFQKKGISNNYQILEVHLNELIANTDFQNYEDILIFRSDLIKEIKASKKEGLLNEQDLSSIPSNIVNIFTSLGKSAWDTMFIGIYKGIAKDLGFKTDTFLFRVVVEGLQSMSWSEIIKVISGDCRLATTKLVESLTKGLVGLIGNKIMPGGAGYDIIRRTLMDQFFDNSQVNSILEDAMAPYVCEYLKKWISNAEDKGSKLKKQKQNKSDSESTQSKPTVVASAKKAIGLS